MDNIKKFEEFLDKMQALLDDAKKQGHIIVRVEDLENAFPELQERGDEKIRKSLIDYFDDANKIDENPLMQYGIQTDKVIAWLEKQGEQKATDKIKPKFKVGDWITNGLCTWKIELIRDGLYCQTQCGIECGGDIESIDKEYHLWTIADAKPGDVLVHNSIAFMFIGIENGIVKGICTELCDTISNFGMPEYENDYCPATKEQRDTLFAKMKEAGYEWDAEKKELEITDFSKHLKYNPNVPSISEEKPAWSEEDDYNVQCCIAKAENDIANGCIGRNKELIEWLESLKERKEIKL